MTDKEIVFVAVSESKDVPTELRDDMLGEISLRRQEFDASYIRFLDEQILLKPRGEKWDKRIKRRKACLVPYVDCELIDATVIQKDHVYWLKIDPKTSLLILWERDERNKNT
jgi:hypothetical protein